MLTNEEVEAFKKAWYSFEEIQRINESLKSIENWDVFTEEEAKDYINNQVFAKYKAYD